MPPRDRDRKRSPKDTGRKVKKKICIFCKDRIDWVDYKDVNLLRKFMSDRGKIRARRVSGNCAQHQREVAVAIKTARELALLPYTQRTMTEGRGPRGDRRGGPRPDVLEAPTVAAPVEESEDLEDLEDLGDDVVAADESEAVLVAADGGEEDVE